MFDYKQKKDLQTGHHSTKTPRKRSNSLDEGVIAFGEWLMSVDVPGLECGPLSLKRFAPEHQATLFDSVLKQDVTVQIIDGIPECQSCHEADCAHVGFTICASQMNRRNGMVNLT